MNLSEFPERFREKVVVKDGCWVWGACKSAKGYGRFVWGKKDGRVRVWFAHRWAFEWKNGPVGAGLELDHLCRNRGCVNPSHLEPVSHIENCRRGAWPSINERIAKGIKKALSEGATSGLCMAMFGVSKAIVANIQKNKTWRNV